MTSKIKLVTREIDTSPLRRSWPTVGRHTPSSTVHTQTQGRKQTKTQTYRQQTDRHRDEERKNTQTQTTWTSLWRAVNKVHFHTFSIQQLVKLYDVTNTVNCDSGPKSEIEQDHMG